MTIAAILSGRDIRVETVACDTTVRDAVKILATHKIGSLPVLRDGKVAGIMSERDIIYCLAADGDAILDWPVERIMTTPAITAETDKAILSALSLMTQRRIRHLPVVEAGHIGGLVSIGDLVKYRMDQIEQEAEAMLTYIQSV